MHFNRNQYTVNIRQIKKLTRWFQELRVKTIHPDGNKNISTKLQPSLSTPVFFVIASKPKCLHWKTGEGKGDCTTYLGDNVWLNNWSLKEEDERVSSWLCHVWESLAVIGRSLCTLMVNHNVFWKQRKGSKGDPDWQDLEDEVWNSGHHMWFHQQKCGGPWESTGLHMFSTQLLLKEVPHNCWCKLPQAFLLRSGLKDMYQVWLDAPWANQKRSPVLFMFVLTHHGWIHTKSFTCGHPKWQKDCSKMSRCDSFTGRLGNQKIAGTEAFLSGFWMNCWLCPIEQQFISVSETVLRSERRTGGSLSH